VKVDISEFAEAARMLDQALQLRKKYDMKIDKTLPADARILTKEELSDLKSIPPTTEKDKQVVPHATLLFFFFSLRFLSILQKEKN
jgi:hypothetical protein